MSQTDHEYPFPPDDNPWQTPSADSWRRHRAGTSREAWNRLPMWRYDSGPLKGLVAPQCAHCGYREHMQNMLVWKRGEWLIPGEDDAGALCFTCHLIESKPGAVTDYWTKMDPPKEDPAKGTRVTTSGLSGLPTGIPTRKG